MELEALNELDLAVRDLASIGMRCPDKDLMFDKLMTIVDKAQAAARACKGIKTRRTIFGVDYEV